ncbi:MAG: acyloxyacyl hydrolase [Salinarimonadaceae bacterium]|nr:MAG: acyloxyacyl hydrolase [Salinarimonadaceae bacterium]
MRTQRTKAFVFAAFVVAAPVIAAPEARAGGEFGVAAPQPPVALRTAFISETRIGVMAGASWTDKAGSPSLQGEVLFGKPFNPADLFLSYFVPRPHFGASLSLGGGAHFAFAGLTWNVDVGDRVFLEASFGGAIQEGGARGTAPPGSGALGCSPVFRESASIGYRLTERVAVTATVERFGDRGLCDPAVGAPRAVTNVGARIGYAF